MTSYNPYQGKVVKQKTWTCSGCGAPRPALKWARESKVCYACANKARAALKLEQLASFKALGAKPITPKALQALRARLTGRGHHAHEVTILETLPSALIPYWFGLPGKPKYKLQSIQNNSFVRCRSCGTLTGGKEHCTLQCHHDYMHTGLDEIRAKVEEFQRRRRGEPYTFTASDSLKYKAAAATGPNVSGKEFMLIWRLMNYDDGLAAKYINLRASSMKGRKLLARGRPEQRCLECHKAITLSFNDDGISMKLYCGSKCSNSSARVKALKVKTCLKRFGVSHHSQNATVKADTEARCLTKYGVRNVMQLQEFQSRSKSARLDLKPTALGDRMVDLQGYELQALAVILRKHKWPALDIRPQDVRIEAEITPIAYAHNGKTHTYFPDFFIPKRNLVIEVKSWWTAFSTEDVFKRNQSKAKACMSNGIGFKLMVMEKDGRLLQVPRDWYRRTYSAFLRAVGFKLLDPASM